MKAQIARLLWLFEGHYSSSWDITHFSCCSFIFVFVVQPIKLKVHKVDLNDKVRKASKRKRRKDNTLKVLCPCV